MKRDLKSWLHLEKRIQTRNPTPESEHDRLEELWLYQAFNQPHRERLLNLLNATEPHARAAATRVLRDWHASMPDALDLLVKLIGDPSPRVRLEAITTLENISSEKSLEIALRALDKPTDANIDYALFHAANALKEKWLPAVESGAYAFDGNIRALSFALQAVGSKSGVTPLLKLLKEGKIPAENQENVLGLIGGLGGPGELNEIFTLLESSSDAGLRVKSLTALERAARERRVKPGGDLAGIKKLLEDKDQGVAAAALRVAGAWKLENLRDEISAALNNPTALDAIKLAALDALTALGGPKSIATFSDIVKANTGASVRARTVASLSSLDANAAIAPAAALLAQPLDAASAADLFAAFAKKEGAGKALAAALAAGKMAPENAEAGLHYFNASGQAEPELTALFKSILQGQAAGASASPNLPGKKPADIAAAMNADEKKTIPPDEMKALLAEAQQHGDAARGEKIFRRKTLSCFSCHNIGGAGGQVGPDLSNVGAASQVDYIIDSVLSPNKTVKEGYNSWLISTTQGERYTGNIVRETATHLILRDGTTDEITVPLNLIKKRTPAGSLMPNGLADSLTRGEFADLIRFLSELGKPGPFSVAQSVAVRRVRFLDPVPESIAAAAAADIPKVLAKRHGFELDARVRGDDRRPFPTRKFRAQKQTHRRRALRTGRHHARKNRAAFQLAEGHDALAGRHANRRRGRSRGSSKRTAYVHGRHRFRAARRREPQNRSRRTPRLARALPTRWREVRARGQIP